MLQSLAPGLTLSKVHLLSSTWQHSGVTQAGAPLKDLAIGLEIATEN